MFGTQMTDEFFARAHRRRRRVPQRRAEGAARRRWDRPRLRARAHRGLRRAARGARARVVRPTSSGSRARRAPTWSASPACTRPRAPAVLVWSMGITQHEHGSDNVAAIVNLGLARGNVGRRGAGLMPIRGHSGVQGGAEMGAYATAFPGRRRRRPPSRRPRSASSTASRSATGPASPRRRWSKPAARGELDVLYSSGGNFLEVLPDPDAVDARAAPGAAAGAPGHRRVEPDARRPRRRRRAAARRHPLRAARRRHRDHHRAPDRVQPRDPGHQVGRGAQRVGDLRRPRPARRPGARAPRARSTSGQEIRDEIARVVPSYAGVERLRATGDAIQWGGTRLCEGGSVRRRPTAGRASLPVAPADTDVPHGQLPCSAPGAASSSTRWCTRPSDPLTGAMRDALFIVASATSTALGVRDGDRVVVRSAARRDARRACTLATAPSRQRAGVLPRGQRAAARPDAATRRRACPTTTRIVTVEAAR